MRILGSFLRSTFGTQAGQVFATAIFLCSDGLHFVFFDPMNSYFLSVLRTPGKESVLLVLGLTLLYTLSLGFVSTLKPTNLGPTKRRTWGKKRRGPPRHWPDLISYWPTWGFGIMMLMILGEVTGWSSAEDTSISEQFEYGAVTAGLLLFFLHLALGVGDLIEPKHDNSSLRYFVYLIPCVLIAEVMLNLSFAAWLYYFVPEPDAVPIDDPDMFWSFVILGPMFYFLFAAPRFIFMRLNFTWTTLSSGLALMLYELWRIFQRHPIW